MDRRTVEYLATHVAPLCTPTGPTRAVYCHEGLWWATNGAAAVTARLGPGVQSGRYLGSDLITAAADPTHRVRPIDFDGDMHLCDGVVRVPGLTNSRRKWRRSSHRVEELLERCPDGMLAVSELVRRRAAHRNDQEMWIDGSRLRQLLRLCPEFKPSVQRRSPSEPLVIVTWRWTAGLQPYAVEPIENDQNALADR